MSGSSEMLQRLRRVNRQLYKINDVFHQEWIDLRLERELEISVRSEDGQGYWHGDFPMTVGPLVPASILAERLKEWQHCKQVMWKEQEKRH